MGRLPVRREWRLLLWRFLNILKSGDEIVSGSGIFGGTHSLFKNLSDYGIVTRYAEDSEVESFRKGR